MAEQEYGRYHDRKKAVDCVPGHGRQMVDQKDKGNGANEHGDDFWQ